MVRAVLWLGVGICFSPGFCQLGIFARVAFASRAAGPADNVEVRPVSRFNTFSGAKLFPHSYPNRSMS